MTVIILGAGVMQLPAIRIARELGWKAVVADANSEAVGARLGDAFLHIDLKDREALEAAALRLKAEGGLDGVFTAGTDFSASVAWVAERLGLPGIPYESALRASNKVKMREAFSKAGLSSPRFVAVESPRGSRGSPPLGRVEASLAAAGIGFPLVVKPADNMGARGCRLARGSAELESALAEALPLSRTATAIVEEYVDGPEFSIDAIVVDGDIRIRGIADRVIAFSPYFVELGHTMPSAQPPEVRAMVLELFRKGVRALGIDRGAAKGDIKYSISRGRAVIGEIAARLSGGYMSGWTYPYASGIEVTREGLEVAVGLVPPPAPEDRGWVSAERAFISVPGRVHSVLGLREAQCLPYVKDLFLRVEPGARAVFPSNNVEKCGNVISQAPDRAAAIGAAESAVAGIMIRLEPGNADTEAFLRGEGGVAGPEGARWPPAAFRLGPEAERALELMSADAGKSAEPGEAGGTGALLVPPFPLTARPTGLDWSHRGFSESAEMAMRLAGARQSPAGDGRLGARFWRAVAAGGAQAGLYVLDTARASGG